MLALNSKIPSGFFITVLPSGWSSFDERKPCALQHRSGFLLTDRVVAFRNRVPLTKQNAAAFRQPRDENVLIAISRYGERLQGDRAVRTADQHVRAQPGDETDFRACASIVAGEAGEVRIGRRPHRPYDLSTRSRADVESEFGDYADIDFTAKAGIGRHEFAGHFLLRSDDQAYAAGNVTGQRSSLNTILCLCADRQCQRGCDAEQGAMKQLHG
ncbi:MAG TPA: hypothetical protein PKB01_05185 [Xanthobacteraceae bacterium]|nr:hypothetical protein [Xanthobacteraceae bacterium]